MDPCKVDRASWPWKHHRHVLALQRTPAAAASRHAVEGERASRRQCRQILHAARGRRGRVVVARVLAHPQLEGHQPIPATVVSIVNDDLAHEGLCLSRGCRQLDRDPRCVLLERVAHGRDLIIVNAVGRNVRHESRAHRGSETRELKERAQWRDGRGRRRRGGERRRRRGRRWRRRWRWWRRRWWRWQRRR